MYLLKQVNNNLLRFVFTFENKLSNNNKAS